VIREVEQGIFGENTKRQFGEKFADSIGILDGVGHTGGTLITATTDVV
jgi:hypothetical protein